jgi:hypothetical protein
LATSDARRCSKQITWITHKWWHPMAWILWALTRRIMESHEDIWDMCEVHKWIRRVSPRKATLMMCGTNEGIAKRRCKPPIIEDCLLSTPRDHSRWKARRPR